VIDKGYPYRTPGSASNGLFSAWSFRVGKMSPQRDHIYIVVEPICEKLLKAKWIESYSTCDSLDYQIIWTDLGDCRRRLLRHVIENFRLEQNFASAVEFTMECQRLAGKPAECFTDSAKEFWSACCLQVDLPCEEDVLWAFVRILTADQKLEQPSHECLVKIR
jgi:hypothetical protein